MTVRSAFSVGSYDMELDEEEANTIIIWRTFGNFGQQRH